MEEKFINPVRNGVSNGVKLTNTVYKVLEFFPESDPLKNRAKDKALAIMDNLVLVSEIRRPQGWVTLANTFDNKKIKVQILEDIEILLGYLWIGKTQGWLNSVNCLIIANEYEKIRNGIGPIVAPIVELTQKLPGIIDKSPAVAGQFDPLRQSSSEASEPVTIPEERDLGGESDRQKLILDYLAKNEKAQVMDLQTVLPDITKRTIRRDLDELLEAGTIIRVGEFNQVYYKLNG